MKRDHVDDILDQWRRERPDLDPSPMAVVGRISRLARYFGRALETHFAGSGLSSGEFDVLATLRRSGPPFRLNPTDLFKTLMLSSGAMTHRLDRLERAGLIARTPDPNDRRGTLVELTPRGREVVDAVVGSHVANEQRLLDALSSEEREQLAQLLRKLLITFDDPAGPDAGSNDRSD